MPIQELELNPIERMGLIELRIRNDHQAMIDEILRLRSLAAMNDAVTAWAAGIFEGEGSICCRPTGIAIRLAMCDEDIVKRWGEAIGAGLGRGPFQPKPAGSKPQWIWSVYKIDDIEAVIIRFRPWLGARRIEQCERAFDQYWSARRKPAAAPSAAPGVEEG